MVVSVHALSSQAGISKARRAQASAVFMNPAVIFAVIALHGLVWAKSETRKLLRHPSRENEPNAGLPDACLTYAERYNLAFDPK